MVRSDDVSSSHLPEVKNNKNLKLSGLRVVAYRRFQLYSEMTGEILVFWKSGRLQGSRKMGGGHTGRFDCISFVLPSHLTFVFRSCTLL